MSVFGRLIVTAALTAAVVGTTDLGFAAPRRSRAVLAQSLRAQSGLTQPGSGQLVQVQPEVLPTPPATTPTEPPAMLPVIPPNHLALVNPRRYRVRVKHHRTLRRTCCGSCAARAIILDVQDPANRPVAFPMSIPGCCPGDPIILKDRDILGRYSYTYLWQSGYKIDVVFRPRGDIVVHTWGR